MEVGDCADVSNALIDCVIENCYDAVCEESDADFGDADLTEDCEVAAQEMCSIASQTANDVGDCCPQCAEKTFEYFVCFIETTNGAFCPSASCGEWTTSGGESESCGTLAAAASGAVMAIGLML